MEKITLREERNEKQATLEGMVARLTELSPGEINTLKFNQACEYMERLEMNSTIAQEFLQEPMFWAWWNQQWALVDECFVHEARRERMAVSAFRRMYEDMHEHIDTFPDRVIFARIHEAYERMAGKVINKKMKAL